MQAQIIHHLCLNRFLNLYLQGLPLSLAMKIFSVKVLRFTIQCYRTVDLMRTSNTARRIGVVEKKKKPFQNFYMVQPSFQQKCKNECWKAFSQIAKETLRKKP